MSGLTQTQADCLNAIIRLTTPEGITPSYDELCAAIGTTSKGSVNRIVQALEARGYVERTRYARRNIRVLIDPTVNGRADAIMADIMASHAGPFIGEQSRILIRDCIARGLAQ